MPLDVIECPFTVIVDSREQRPFTFCNLRAGADRQFRPLHVPWKWGQLKSGDYSIDGLESELAIERKSLIDLFNSCGNGRERFEREFQRLAEYKFAAIVVEADWKRILKRPPRRSKLSPKCVFRTCLSWSIRYGVHWFAMPDRRLAEITTFRLLEKYHLEKLKESKNGN